MSNPPLKSMAIRQVVQKATRGPYTPETAKQVLDSIYRLDSSQGKVKSAEIINEICVQLNDSGLPGLVKLSEILKEQLKAQETTSIS